MVWLRLSLMVGGVAALYVGIASWSAGYPAELAIVRGVLGFMAVTFVGYVAELIVATAPPAEADAGGAQDGTQEGEAAALASAGNAAPARIPAEASTERPPAAAEAATGAVLDATSDDAARQLRAA